MADTRAPQFTNEEIANRFIHHPPPRKEVVGLHERTRQLVLDLAIDLNNSVPDGREKALMVTHLEETLMWANKAIARTHASDAEPSRP